MSELAAAAVLSSRCIRLSRRTLDALLTSLMLPIMLMVMFVYLFGGAINTGTRYVTYVVPGVLLLCAGFGSATTAVFISNDMTGGIVDRFRSMDVGGAAVLAGHTIASLLRNCASTVLVLAVAVAIGFRPHASVLYWAAAAGFLSLFILAISALSAVMGLLAKSPEAANGFAFFAMFLPYPSSAFVPVHTMPSWLQGFALHQPVTTVNETIRGLLLGSPIGDNWWLALTWCTGVLVASIGAAGFVFRRRTN